MKLEYETMLKRKRNQQEINAYTSTLTNVLIDLASCKCDYLSTCNCSENKKVPLGIKDFLKDMISACQMCYADVSRILEMIEDFDDLDSDCTVEMVQESDGTHEMIHENIEDIGNESLYVENNICENEQS